MERLHSLSIMSRFLLVHYLILISLLIASATANISTITPDRDALLAMKAHITHDPTNFFAKNWNTSISFCNWTGVTCDVHSHRVTVLNISRLNLTGTIPSQLGNLSSLQSLNLSFNRLSGSIPSAIFTTYTLKYVSFRENQLSGAFPSFIYNKSSLQHLDFSFNTLSGEIPASICSNLPFLEYISLSKNMFHGGIPSALSKCTYLRILSLSYNDLSGAVPKDIGNLSKLKELYLGRNRLQGEIPRGFGNLTELELMSLSENELQGGIPQELGNLTKLEMLQLFWNNLTGRSPRKLSKTDRWLMIWWAVSGLIHIIHEGYWFFSPEFYKDKSGNYFAEVWKEYSKGDSRYASRHVAVLAIEGIAVIFVGPASLLAMYAIAKGKSYSYILQFALSLVQFYGSSLYFITAFLEGNKFACTRYFYYSYFIAQGGTWLLFPALIMIRCWKRICAACLLLDHKTKVY